jgi:hypothetical protein
MIAGSIISRPVIKQRIMVEGCGMAYFTAARKQEERQRDQHKI